MQIASCGHALQEEEGTAIAIKGWTREWRRSVNYMTLCDDCFLLYSTEYAGSILNTEDEQHKWMVGDDNITADR